MAITADIDETDRAGIALCANQVPGSSARSRLPWAGGSRCSCASRGGNQGHRSLTDLASCLRARKGALCRPVPTPITPKYATCSPHLGVRYPSRKQMVSPEAETPAVRRPGPGHRRPLHRHPSALQRWQRSAGRSRTRSVAFARLCPASDCFLDFDCCFDSDAFVDHRDRGHVSRPARRGYDTCGVTPI